MVLVLVAPAGAVEAATEFEFLRLLPHVGRDGHRSWRSARALKTTERREKPG